LALSIGQQHYRLWAIVDHDQIPCGEMTINIATFNDAPINGIKKGQAGSPAQPLMILRFTN